MKKVEQIILFFLFSLLVVFFFAPSARAATCSYQCNNLSQYNQSQGADFCYSLGGVITTNILTDCPTPANCGLGNVPVCCCNTGNFSLNKGQLTNNAAAPVKDPPKFTIPELSVKIPGMAEFSQGSCQTDSSGKTTCAVNWIGEYVGGIYKYATGIAGIIAVIVLMLAGIIWLVSGGDASQIGKSKEMIIGAVSGLVILLCSYILLYQINPELTRFKSLTLGYIEDFQPIPENTTDFSNRCQPTNSGDCAVANMSIFGSKANQASAICMAESGGVATISNKSTRCTGGEYAVWGLFQFNLSANKFVDDKGKTLDCPKAFGNKAWVNSDKTCTVKDPILYQACITAASNPALSISNAYRLSGGAASNWGPWEANSKWCHF